MGHTPVRPFGRSPLATITNVEDTTAVQDIANFLRALAPTPLVTPTLAVQMCHVLTQPAPVPSLCAHPLLSRTPKALLKENTHAVIVRSLTNLDSLEGFFAFAPSPLIATITTTIMVLVSTL